MTPLESFLAVSEMDNGAVFADSIFQRKYRAPAPRHGHHLIAWYRVGPDTWRPASYLNYMPFREAMLIGGACTDGAVVRSMTPEQRSIVDSAGGLMMILIRHFDEHRGPDGVGTFAYCGDERSWAVVSQCGYVRLDGDPHLIVRWTREPAGAARAALVEAIRGLGPF